MNPGTIIDGKYKIVGTLGTGGFGEVYEALHIHLNRPVALKLLKRNVLAEEGGLTRFEREAKAVDSFNHKNIVRFYEYGMWQREPYMVLELVTGSSLQSMIGARKQIDPTTSLRLIRQVCEALACAHAAGVVHRDLKPSNIMINSVDGADVVKVIDFGLARLMPGYGISAQKLTETGQALGTCHYMSPEQAQGTPVDQRADIYATGCILHQMIAGTPPFDADDNIAILYQHLEKHAPRLDSLVALAAPLDSISDLVKKCMAKRADDRYQDSDALIKDIDLILAGKPLPRIDDKAITTARHRKKPKPVAIVVTSVIVCLAALGAAIFQQWQVKKEHEEHRRDLIEAMQTQIGRITTPKYLVLLEAWKAEEHHTLGSHDRRLLLNSLAMCDEGDALLDTEQRIDLGRDLIKYRNDRTFTLESYVNDRRAQKLMAESAEYDLNHPNEHPMSNERKLEAYYLVIDFYRRDTPRAMRYLDNAIALRDQNPRLRRALTDGQIMFLLQVAGDNEHQTAFYEKALKAQYLTEEQKRQVKFGLAANYHAANRLDESRELFRALASDPSPRYSCLGKFGLSNVLTEEGKLHEATAVLDSMRNLDTQDYARQSVGLARIAFLKKQYQLAYDLCTQAEDDLSTDRRSADLLWVSPRLIRIACARAMKRTSEVPALIKELYAERKTTSFNDMLNFDMKPVQDIVDHRAYPRQSTR